MTKQKRIKKVLIGIFFSIAILFSSAMLFLGISYSKAKLSIEKLTNVNTGVKLYSADYINETEPYSYNLDRTIVDINELDSHTINAFISIEDKRFYSHNGYDIKRIVKSALVNLKNGGKTQGASTITQQLVKNTLLTNEKTYKRKLNEVMLAIKVEKEFTKEEIMNMYLNTIYFGSNAYGIESASQLYFNKSATQLNINESAILAGLIKNPSKYSPIYNTDNCFKRKNLVLKEMFKNGYITKDEYKNNLKLNVESTEFNNGYENSYYQKALIEACELLGLTEKEFIRHNYQIITNLNLDMQNMLKELYKNLYIDADKLTIIANNEGEVLAYIGDSNYNLSNIKRNPASSLKPFAVYLPCLEHNIIYSCSPILDEEINYNGYSPNNYDNSFNGWTSAKQCLANSLNVPAVKLLDCLTINKSASFLEELGINVDEKDKNLTLALGNISKGISPTKLLELYNSLQNAGVKHNLRFVNKILDENGFVIYENKPQTKTVCSEENAYILTDMLIESSRSGTAKQFADLNFEIASKTGTNSFNGNIIDLYNICYTSNLSVLSWFGDAENTGLNLTSSYEVTKLNKKIIEQIYKNKGCENFKKPNTVVEKEIDLLEYNLNNRVVLATEQTPERYKRKELFSEYHLPVIENSLYSSPNLEFDLEITNTGVKINILPSNQFDYKIIKTANNQTYDMDFSGEEFVDGRAFCYDFIKYKIKAINKYTSEEFYSEEKEIYPKQYLLSNLKNQQIVYDLHSKKRWYV